MASWQEELPSADVAEPQMFASTISRGGWRVESTSPQLRSDLRGLCKAQDDLMKRMALQSQGSDLVGTTSRKSCGGWFGLVFKNQGI